MSHRSHEYPDTPVENLWLGFWVSVAGVIMTVLGIVAGAWGALVEASK